MQMHAGVSEIYSRRVSSSVVCSLLHQLTVLFIYLALGDFNILHPFSWLKTCFSTLLSLRLLAFVIFMSLVTFLQVIFFTKRLTRSPPLSLTRLKAVLHVFSVDSVFLFLLHVLTGFAVGYTYVNLIKSNGDDDEYIFKLLCASFTGGHFFVHSCYNSQSFIQLPPLSGLPVKSQIKQSVTDCIKNSIWPVMASFLYFNILYYICGGTLGEILLSLPGVGDKATAEPLGFLQLFSLWRLISSYILCLFIFHILASMKAITIINLSCSWKFPISSAQGHIILSEALTQNTMPSIQQLASQDLLVIAESDPSRRAELYTLSQPGGHPHTWTGVLKPFLTLVDKMCADLSLTPQVETAKPVAPPEDVYFPIASPTLRSLSPPIVPKPVISTQKTPTCNSMSSKAKEWVREQLNLLLKKPPIAFVFGERTEAKIAHALIIQGQTLSNLVSAFSTIAQASYTEDSFGVVQQDLPSIIIAMLKLKSALDKLGNTLRKQNKSQLLIHLNIRSALREAIVQGVYRIVITFKDNLNSLTLPAEVKHQLHSFIQFKES